MISRYLVTGAQGFVGRYVVAHLLAISPRVEVRGVGRSPLLAQAFTHSVGWVRKAIPAPLPPDLGSVHLDPRYKYAPLDLSEPEKLGSLLSDFAPQAVIHLASSLRDDPPLQLVRTNIEGTIHLMEALEAAPASLKILIVASSGGVYGAPPDKELPIAETCRCEPVDFYSMSKLAMEHAFRILAQRSGTPMVVARLFNIVGAGQDERHVCGRFAAQAAAMAARALPACLDVGSLQTTRDFIDVRDVAHALKILVECGTPGEIYNVGSGVETSIAEVLNTTLRLAGCLGDVTVREMHAANPPIRRHFADISRLRGLGFRPGYELGESLDWTLRYYQQTVAATARAIDYNQEFIENA